MQVYQQVQVRLDEIFQKKANKRVSHSDKPSAASINMVTSSSSSPNVSAVT